MRIDQLTVEEQLKVLRNKWHKLARLEYPCQVIQNEAVTVNPFNIRFINNPSLETQLLCVRLNPNSFYFIKDTKYTSVKVLAVSLYEQNILFINKPSDELVFLAISKEGSLLDCLRYKNVFKGKNGNVELTEHRLLARNSKYIY